MSLETQNKGLRRGFTTGSCGAAAAKAAAILLLTGEKLPYVHIQLPNAQELVLPIFHWDLTKDSACCAIQKDSGDDPDVTNGITIYATIKKIPTGITIDGGQGVGRVTAKGLDQPIGNAAINRVPRLMIAQAIEEAMKYANYTGGLSLIISVPQGEMIAKKTFNPRLGIIGGISILGTSGIVEPMSEQALLDSIRLEIHMKAANGYEYLALTPGNYGQSFLKDNLSVSLDHAVKISNFIGDSLIAANSDGLKGVLLVGHIGKLVKLAGGISQTHSRNGDCRLELLAAHSALAKADHQAITGIMEAVSTEAALEILQERGLLATVMASILKKIEATMSIYCGTEMQFGLIVFSSHLGLLAQSITAEDLVKKIKEKEKD